MHLLEQHLSASGLSSQGEDKRQPFVSRHLLISTCFIVLLQHGSLQAQLSRELSESLL